MMMQSRWGEHGSAGELAVFGATSYFAGCQLPAAPDDDCRPSNATEPCADRLYFQAAKVQHDTRTRTMEDNSFRCPHHQLLGLHLHDHAERHATLLRWQPSGKSKLAALLSFMVSPSPSSRASFCKEKKQEAPSMTRLRQAEAAASAAGGEREPANHTYYYKANSPSSSSRESMQLQGLFGGAHDDDDELDLGVVTGDRRLQGITVVRGSCGDEQKRWVVRCVPVPAGPGGACWDGGERGEKVVLDAESAASSEQNMNIKDDELVEVEQLQGDDGGDGNIGPPAHSHSWDSDSSSDLFDLDLEYR